MNCLKKIIINIMTLIAVGAVAFVFASIDSDLDPALIGLILTVSCLWLYHYCLIRERENDGI